MVCKLTDYGCSKQKLLMKTVNLGFLAFYFFLSIPLFFLPSYPFTFESFSTPGYHVCVKVACYFYHLYIYISHIRTIHLISLFFFHFRFVFSSFQAPEIVIIDDIPYTSKVDIFSVGVLLYQMVFNSFPFGRSSINVFVSFSLPYPCFTFIPYLQIFMDEGERFG